MNIPAPEPLPGSTTPVPYIIVADGGFGMKEYMLRPYLATTRSKDNQIFNYRLSRAKRISENAFGILSHRFEVFRSPIRLIKPEAITSMVLCTIVLHNYLRSKSSTRLVYSPQSLIDSEDVVSGQIINGDWRNELSKDKCGGLKCLQKTGTNYSQEAKIIRDLYREYFVGIGAVSWQENRF